MNARNVIMALFVGISQFLSSPVLAEEINVYYAVATVTLSGSFKSSEKWTIDSGCRFYSLPCTVTKKEESFVKKEVQATEEESLWGSSVTDGAGGNSTYHYTTHPLLLTYDTRSFGHVTNVHKEHGLTVTNTWPMFYELKEHEIYDELVMTIYQSDSKVLVLRKYYEIQLYFSPFQIDRELYETRWRKNENGLKNNSEVSMKDWDLRLIEKTVYARKDTM